MLDNESYEMVHKNVPALKVPFEKERYNMYMIIETHSNGSQQESDEKLMSFIGSMSNCIENGIIAKDTNQIKQIWSTREKIADAFVEEGIVMNFLLFKLSANQSY